MSEKEEERKKAKKFWLHLFYISDGYDGIWDLLCSASTGCRRFLKVPKSFFLLHPKQIFLLLKVFSRREPVHRLCVALMLLTVVLNYTSVGRSPSPAAAATTTTATATTLRPYLVCWATLLSERLKRDDYARKQHSALQRQTGFFVVF